jgi:hypothetical protein
MRGHKKQSPIHFPKHPIKTEDRNGFEVACSYGNDDFPLVVIDLSHIPKWEIYDRQLAGKSLGSIAFPQTPGQVTCAAGSAVSLIRPSVAHLWKLDGCADDKLGDITSIEITDGYALIALIGKLGPRVMEKITDLDLKLSPDPDVHLVQGPILGVLSKVMVFSSSGGGTGIFIAIPRGSGQSVAEALLDAGSSLGMQPAGQAVFDRWLQQMPG